MRRKGRGRLKNRFRRNRIFRRPQEVSAPPNRKAKRGLILILRPFRFQQHPAPAVGQQQRIAFDAVGFAF